MIPTLYHRCGFAFLTGSILVTAAAKIDAQALPPAEIPAPQTASYATCQPPAPSEYLLLVVTRTPDTQTQVQQLLPPNTSVNTCNYLDDTVTRVGGFRTVDRANAWAKYMTETTGLAAFVARPAESPQSSSAAMAAPAAPSAIEPQKPSTAPSTTPKPNELASYSPKPLGAGYAVLVDYQNQPEMAIKVRQTLGKEVGLVSYGQRPYLLAVYTADSNAANTALQQLSDRGFWATLVDSRRVILLRRSVSLPSTATTSR